MNKNLHMIDRAVRVLIAIAVFYLIYDGTLEGLWMWVLGILSVVFVATAFISWCPIYAMLGLSTAPKAEGESKA